MTRPARVLKSDRAIKTPTLWHYPLWIGFGVGVAASAADDGEWVMGAVFAGFALLAAALWWRMHQAFRRLQP